MAKQTKAQRVRALQNKIDTEKMKSSTTKENLAKLRAELKHVRKNG